ncbi:hypothetical protein ScalyP_jg5568 [Parmales sp. scaly parma]|nr:hypothetical protein ScalyP_jg5568 [Parmales sp. scaly parma]
MDSSVDQRRKTPAFYGYLPDSNDGRAASFIVMLLLASLHNISRSIGVALLYVVSAQSTFLLLGAEMTVYHLVKLFRSDYTLFVPGIEGGWKIAMAIVFD